MKKTLLLLVGLLGLNNLVAQDRDMALVQGGIYSPLYGSGENIREVTIAPFYMDVTPVTHDKFLEFILEHPEWGRSRVKRLFADPRYLDNWLGDGDVPEELTGRPVNNVSWFAAKAYCECRGKRLPTVDEWEFVAMASEKLPDARLDSLFNNAILRNYEKPRTYMKPVGQEPGNYWGIQDLHGMVWEWTVDFNSVIITGESRANGNTDKGLFCASGAVGAGDLMNYAAFMRYALRSSLKANYNLVNLGFRCVVDAAAGSLQASR